MNRPVPRHVLQPLQPPRNMLLRRHLPAPVAPNLRCTCHPAIVGHPSRERNFFTTKVCHPALLGSVIPSEVEGSLFASPSFQGRDRRTGRALALVFLPLTSPGWGRGITRNPQRRRRGRR